MALYTDSYFRNLAETQSKVFNKSYDSILLENNEAYTQFDIFLSHSYLDKDVITGINLELTKLGYSVYVDWVVDNNLSRKEVNKDTVQTITSRMNQCKCLYYATSQNSSSSKWMPWELGYMDGKKSKCAILPVSTSGYTVRKYQGQEYLSVYPYVVKHLTNYHEEKLWIVEDPTKYVLFDQWLNGSKPFKQETEI